MRWRKRTGPRAPTSFVIIPATHPTTGRPCVVLTFGKLGRIALEGDDVERLKAELDNQLAAATELGTT